MKKTLKRIFYNRPAPEVAPELLGKYLVHGKYFGKIVEVEAYMGVGDLASHAGNGETPRTKIMFEEPGHAYVYLIYGMYYCFNVVCSPEGTASAVLIRALECPGCDGPGKLCRELRITKQQNGIDLTGSDLYIEDRGLKISPRDIVKTPRIGVDYAGEWAQKPWRFAIKNSPYLSRRIK